MAAPLFVQKSTGATDATGAFTFTGVAAGTIGDLVIIHILIDGTGAISWGTLSAANINALDGTANTWTQVGGTFNIGSPTNAQQVIYMGRRTSATLAPTFVASANTSGDDVYGRMYEYSNASTGTTLATVIENGAVGSSISTSNGQGLYGGSGVGVLEQHAQQFTAPGTGNLVSVTLALAKNGSPSDNLIIELQSDSSNSPSGSVLGTIATVSGTTYSTTISPFGTYTYTTSLAVTSATKYWIVLRRDGARDTSNHYWVGTVSESYGGGLAKEQASGAWGVDTTDRAFNAIFDAGAGSTLSIAATSGTISDAAVTTLGSDRRALNFIGINDDNAIPEFTGETGGDFGNVDLGGAYSDSGGTDASIGLQQALMSTAGTIDGGTASNADATDGWGVVGFALIGTTVDAPPSLVLQPGFVNFQNPGVL